MIKKSFTLVCAVYRIRALSGLIVCDPLRAVARGQARIEYGSNYYTALQGGGKIFPFRALQRR
jgi:hypothetical protein